LSGILEYWKKAFKKLQKMTKIGILLVPQIHQKPKIDVNQPKEQKQTQKWVRSCNNFEKNK
jgi:hypothetical protein